MTADPFELSDDQRYRALKARDARFDGRFIVAVRTTGIYCRPSCPTPIQPLRKNIDFFPTTAAAQRAGLRACKRCRPDASPGSPEWNLRDDLVGRAMRMISRGWLDERSVGDLASSLGLTERHLRRVMIDAVGAPPLSIARAQRAQTARTLIETTTMPFTDVAFASGFSSLRQFNDTVRAVFDATPTRLRSTTKAVPDAPGRLSIRLPFRSPMAAEHLWGWHALRSVPGVAAVEGDVFTTALRLPRGRGVVELRPHDQWVQCDLQLDDVADLAPAVAHCRALLDLDADPAEIDATLAALPALRAQVERTPGLRAPGTCDGFASLVFAVLGQQRSVAAARTLAGRIVERALSLDDPATSADVASLAPFPTASQLAELDLGDIGLNGRAIDTIHTVASTFAGREADLSIDGDRDAVAAELLAIKGIGPWTVNYVRMRVFADPDVHLAGDLIADRAAAAIGLTAADIERVRPWRTYLTHHLWLASTNPKGTS